MRVVYAPEGRHPLILDGLCLHVLSSFQRTGLFCPTLARRFALRGTFQLYDPSPSLSTKIFTFVNISCGFSHFPLTATLRPLQLPRHSSRDIPPEQVGAAPCVAAGRARDLRVSRTSPDMSTVCRLLFHRKRHMWSERLKSPLDSIAFPSRHRARPCPSRCRRLARPPHNPFTLQPTPDRNVLLVTIDTLRADALGCVRRRRGDAESRPAGRREARASHSRTRTPSSRCRRTRASSAGGIRTSTASATTPGIASTRRTRRSRRC